VFNKELGEFTFASTTSGTLSIRVTATDGYGGASPTHDFNFIMNTIPTVTDYTDLLKTVGDSISISTPFTDPDGDTLTYTAKFPNGSTSILPFNIDASTGVLSATFSSSDDLKLYSVEVTATDISSNTRSSTQTVIVNQPPTVDQTQLTQLYALDGLKFSYLTFTTGTFTDTDTLTYSIDGSSTHPAWLTFDADGPRFYGTGAATPIPNSPALVVVATDTVGQTAQVNLNITLSTDNSPTLSNTIPNQTIKTNAAFSITIADDIFADADGDPVVISFDQSSGAAMPSWWSFNPLTRVASGTADGTATTYTVRAWGGTAVSTTFTLTVSGNSDPVVGTTISDFTVYQDIDFIQRFASTAFSDPDGDDLTYSLEAISADSPLPLWIDITSSTRILYGRPSATISGDFKLNILASDSRGGSTYQTVVVTVKSSYSIGTVFAASILIILPVLLAMVYFSAILFMNHESPKHQFDLDHFLKKYDPEYAKKRLMEDIEDGKIEQKEREEASES
jgi:large repetitive protein